MNNDTTAIITTTTSILIRWSSIWSRCNWWGWLVSLRKIHPPYRCWFHTPNALCKLIILLFLTSLSSFFFLLIIFATIATTLIGVFTIRVRNLIKPTFDYIAIYFILFSMTVTPPILLLFIEINIIFFVAIYSIITTILCGVSCWYYKDDHFSQLYYWGG